MSVRAIAASGEQVLNTDTYVSSNIAAATQIYLPAVNAGAGGTVSVDAAIRVESTGGPVQVLTKSGRLVGTVPAKGQGTFVAALGAATGDADTWNYELNAQTPSAFVAPGAGYLQADSVAIVACLVKHGLMKAE